MRHLTFGPRSRCSAVFPLNLAVVKSSFRLFLGPNPPGAFRGGSGRPFSFEALVFRAGFCLDLGAVYFYLLFRPQRGGIHDQILDVCFFLGGSNRKMAAICH